MDEYTNKLYEDFKTKNPLSEISAEDFDNLFKFAQIVPENKDFYDDLIRTGIVSNKLSTAGAMTGTIQYKTVNGVDNATSYVDFGEGVWRVMDIIVNYTGGSGTIQFRAFHYDGTTPLEWFFGASTSSSTFSFNADSQFDELSSKRWGGSTDQPHYLQLGLKPNGTFDASSMTFYVVCYRVR